MNLIPEPALVSIDYLHSQVIRTIFTVILTEGLLEGNNSFDILVSQGISTVLA